MYVPNLPNEKLVDKDGNIGYGWKSFFEQLQLNLQLAVSNQGFQIPPVSSASDSVEPPATGGALQQVQNSFGTQQGVRTGTLVFDPNVANGGAPLNGQLKILLADGTFHPITNT